MILTILGGAADLFLAATVLGVTGRYLARSRRPAPPVEPPRTPPKAWRTASLDDLTAASDLLDVLENQGFAGRELVILGPASFLVRWQC